MVAGDQSNQDPDSLSSIPSRSTVVHIPTSVLDGGTGRPQTAPEMSTEDTTDFWCLGDEEILHFLNRPMTSFTDHKRSNSNPEGSYSTLNALSRQTSAKSGKPDQKSPWDFCGSQFTEQSCSDLCGEICSLENYFQ